MQIPLEYLIIYHSTSSSTTSPTIYSPVTPAVDDAFFPPHLPPSHELPAYSQPRLAPSLSRSPPKKGYLVATASSRRATVCSSKNDTPPPVPPLVHRSCSNPAAPEEQIDRRKCIYDLEKQLTLAQKILFDASPAGRQRGSLLPPIHTEGLTDQYSDSGPASLTPSPTYSSSLYTSDMDHQFPQPPITAPEIGRYTESPMFSEAETCEVKMFLRKRWGFLDAVEVLNVERPLLSSIPRSGGSPGEDMGIWEEKWPHATPQDFSWEAEEKKATAENRDLLEKLGLLEDDQPERGGFFADHPLSTSSPPRRTRIDDVSATLTALRSSPQSVSRSQESGDSGDRDNALRDELRKRLQSQRSIEVIRPRATAIRRPVSTSPAHARARSFDQKSFPPSPCPPVPTMRRPMASLHTPSSSSEYGEARISVQDPMDSSQHSLALERLETSLTRLQAHSPASTPTKMPPQPRSPGILKKPKVPPRDMVMHSARPRPAARSKSHVAMPAHRTREQLQHARSGSAPESAARRPTMLIPADPFRASRGMAQDTFDSVPLEADGMRSFMNFTPEPMDLSLPAHGLLGNAHVRSRSRASVAGAAASQAERARKLLARASSSFFSWGRGLRRSKSERKA
ncbi:hypothetical protein HWV62_9025 [Athelia sp. TMB]|nr:hypothetical protein HWV62_9025 [Athelia sp. TMB]